MIWEGRKAFSLLPALAYISLAQITLFIIYTAYEAPRDEAA